MYNIPKQLFDDKDVKPTGKLLFALIVNLSYNEQNTTGWCWASNKYFAKKMDMSERNASRLINELIELKYLEVELKPIKGTKKVRRYLTEGDWKRHHRKSIDEIEINDNPLPEEFYYDWLED